MINGGKVTTAFNHCEWEREDQKEGVAHIVAHEVEIYRLLAEYTQLPYFHIKDLLPLPHQEKKASSKQKTLLRREGF